MANDDQLTVQTTIMNRNRPFVAKAVATGENGFQVEAVGRSGLTEGRAIKRAESYLESHIEDAEFSYEILQVQTSNVDIEVLDNETRYSGGWKDGGRIPIPPQKVRIQMYAQDRSVEGSGWAIRSLSKALEKARSKAKNRL